MLRTNETTIRPMTAGAGYTSSITDNMNTKRGVKKSIKSTHESTKDTEKKIHKLIEESTLLMIQGERLFAVEKAKEAVKIQSELHDRMISNDSTQDSSPELAFSVWFHLASVYEMCDMFSESIEVYTLIQKKKILHSQENICRLRINMGNAFRSNKKYPEAIKMYRMALDNAPREAKQLKFYVHRMIGNIFVDVGKLKEAIVEYEAVVMSSDADVETCFNLLLCYIKTGYTQKVKQTFLKMVDVFAAKLKLDEKLSSVVTNLKGNPAPSVSLVSDQPENRSNFENDFKELIITATRLICSLFYGNKWIEDLRYLHDQVKDRLPFVAQHIEIEDVLLNFSEYEFDFAIKKLKSYEKKDTELSSAISINLTVIYSLEGNHDIADHYADASLASSRFNPRALVNKGNRLFIKNDYSGARNFYLDAINIDYTNFEAMYNLAITSRRLGFLSESLDCFQKLLVQTKNEPRVLCQLVNIFDDTNDKTSASKWLNLLSSCLPTDPGILLRISDIGKQVGQSADDFSDCFHNALESHRLYPSNLDAIGQLAVWFVRQKQYEKALYFFRCASIIQPKETKWEYMIASCYRKLMKNDEAFIIYESIRAKSPNDKECLKQLIQLSQEIGMPSLDYQNDLREISSGFEAIVH